MPLLVKTFFRQLLLPLLLVLVTVFPASGHEVRPGIVDLSIQPDGRFEAVYRFNFQEAIDQFADKEKRAKIFVRDLNATVKSDADFDKLVALFELVRNDYVKAITIRADGKPVPLILLEVTIPREVPEGSSRVADILLAGELPGGVKSLTWQSDKKLGNVIVRIKGAGKPEKGNGDATENGESKMVFAGVVKAGEESKPVSVTGLVKLSKWDVFVQYLVLGIEHIIPKGLDHILFVVGLFLLSTRLSSLLWQISAFTIAHTITLGLAMAGIVSVPSSIVEPLIAASIVYVAVENMMTSKLHKWRPVIVFMFGLLHGLGFASVLLEIGLAQSNFLVGLVGFNIGVEIGQLTVVAACFLLVGLWFRDKPWYRSYITNPASLLIAVIASWWFIERTFL